MNSSRQNTWFWCAVLSLLVLTAACALVDILGTTRYGQVDLRTRIVGSRALLLQKDPYLFRWSSGDSPRLLDPLLSPMGSISRVTVTPAVLALQIPFVGLDYRFLKSAWLGVEWLLYAGMVWALFPRSSDPEKKRLFILLALLLFCPVFWRLHVGQGQIHILFAFLAAVFYSRIKDGGRFADLLSGCLLGLLVALRPNYALLGFPVLLFRRMFIVLGALAGLSIGIMAPSLISPAVWFQYTDCIMRYVSDARSPVPATLRLGQYPQEIEGVTNLERSSHHKYGAGDTSLKNSLKAFGFNLPGRVMIIGTFAVMLAGMVYLCRLKRAGVDLEFCTIVSFWLVLLSELFLPIMRYPYSDVLLVLIILSLAAYCGTDLFAHPAAIVLILLALAFSLGMKFSLLIIPDAFPSLAVACLMLFVRPRLRGAQP